MRVLVGFVIGGISCLLAAHIINGLPRDVLRKDCGDLGFSVNASGLFVTRVIYASGTERLPSARRPYSVVAVVSMRWHWMVVATVITVSVLWYLLVIRNQSRRVLRDGAPCCSRCGYCLIGLCDDRCPECGVKFDAAVLPKE